MSNKICKKSSKTKTLIYRDIYCIWKLRLLPLCGEIGRQRNKDNTFKYLINYFENQKSADIQNLCDHLRL